MADYSFKGKRRLCYTEVSDFTDFQGIGSDALYCRYNSVCSAVKATINPEYQHFLAVPQYIKEDDQICWHIDEWTETPTRLTELSGEGRDKYEAIKRETVSHYLDAIKTLHGGEELQILRGATKYIDDERIFCADGKVYLVAWGMTPDTKIHKVIGSVIHEYSFVKKFKLTFEPGEHGSFATKLDRYATRAEGVVLTSKDIPQVVCEEGWDLVGWEPSPIGHKVTGDATFTATYKKVEMPPVIPPIQPPPPPIPEPEDIYYNCVFDAGEHGTIDGVGRIRKFANTFISANDIPAVKPKKGYKFTGWNVTPNNCIVDGDKIFVAQYEKKVPWYKRWWLWLLGLFAGRGCLKWILRLLLVILAIWLLLFLLRSCKSCGSHGPVNGVVPIDSIKTPDGTVIDDNGPVRPIGGSDGTLPGGGGVVAPVRGEDGTVPPIIQQPGRPDIIANRLFLFLEDDDDDVEALARDFKQAYPDDRYQIIGFDEEVKLLVIQIPEGERDYIRETINTKIPNHNFIVFDEEVYEINGPVGESPQNVGWHLAAIHLKQGWTYTMGSKDIRIAVVDDGIQASHPMFKGRIVDAYNVFTQNNHLSLGVGHGTHTAGLAAGSDEFYDKGASGVAPKCLLMPVQVFDNQQCPLSALVAGVMYAIHHDADVVNISIGPSFKGLNAYPVSEQEEISKTEFQNVAILWNRVCKLAAAKNCILVFAAGNDDILTSIPPENRNESSVVVTAVDKRMYPTTFTNYGYCSDVSAPGKDIYSSFPTSTFKSYDGTSMAAPIVSGTIALMKCIKKDLTVEQARNAIYSTGADVYGWIPPMVLVDKALEATQNGNFERVKRVGRSVPDDADVHLHSGKVPTNGVPPVSTGGDGGGAGGGVVPTPPAQPSVPAPVDGTDDNALQKMLEELIRQRDKLNERIDSIEAKLNHH